MSARRPVTASADTRREMPAGTGGRIDGIHAALASLEAEERRLARLGFEAPLRRCREQQRYWRFLEALFSMNTPSRGPRILRGGS